MGGKAFGCGRIEKGAVSDIYNRFLEDMEAMVDGVDFYKKSAIVGSAGKVKTSGDIDIAVEINCLCAHTRKSFLLALMLALDETDLEYRDFSHLGFVSIKYPQAENPTEASDYAQIDVIAVENLEWSKWAYYTDQHSKWKSLYRNEIIYNMCRWTTRLLDAYGTPESLTTHQYERYYFDPNRGLLIGTETLAPQRKHPIKPKPEDKRIVIYDPSIFCEFLFGIDDLVPNFEIAIARFDSVKSATPRGSAQWNMTIQSTMDCLIRKKKLAIPPDLQRLADQIGYA